RIFEEKRSARYAGEQRWHSARRRQGRADSYAGNVRDHIAHKHARRAPGGAGVRFVPEKERRAAHRECLKRRRPIGRWRRWLGTRLLHFKNGTQRRYLTTGCGFAEIRRQFRLSGLGPD